MEYRYLGRTGVQVSEVGLGTMTFGNEADEATSRAILDRAFEKGVNLFDSAQSYNNGESERIVGRWLGTRRPEVVLASKAYFPYGGGMNDARLSRRNLVRSVEASLKAFGTDYLDLLYLHHWDDTTDLREPLGTLNTLIQQGKVLYGAISNFSAWQVMKALSVADAHGWPRPVCIQPMYSLVKRQAEVELLPLAAAEGLGVLPYNALGGGLLTGKYLGETDASARFNRWDMYRQRYGADQYRQVTERFVGYAREAGVSPTALALAWVAGHPNVTSALVGARSVGQLDEALGCLDLGLTPEARQSITALSVDPPSATDR